MIGALVAGLVATGTPAEAAVAKPSASNTGVPAGKALTKYTGPLTITTAGTVIDGKAVYGDLKIQAKNVIIRNSYLHCGTNIPSGNSGCIDANSGSVYNLQVLNNTIIPDRPSYYRDGIVGHEYTARYNNVVGSVVAGDGLGTYGTHAGSALMVNQNVAKIANMVVDSNWFDRGQNSVCIQYGKYSNVTMTLQTTISDAISTISTGARSTPSGSTPSPSPASPGCGRIVGRTTTS